MKLDNLNLHIEVLKILPVVKQKSKKVTGTKVQKATAEKTTSLKTKLREISQKEALAIEKELAIAIHAGQANGTTRPAMPLSTISSRTVLPSIKVDGVFEGGGALGTAYIGSLRALWDNNVWFDRIAGTSAGAIIAALTAAGYTIDELEYLTAPANSVAKPVSFINTDITPIDFRQLMDFALSPSQIDKTTKQNTFLYQFLSGKLLYDNILNAALPIPTKNSLRETIVSKLPDLPFIDEKPILSGAIKNALDAIPGIPDDKVYVKDFLPSFIAERETFATQLWDSFAALNPGYVILLNYITKGGICKGDKILSVVEKLIKFKTGKNNAKFADLPNGIELALLSTDANTGSRVVYSRKNDRVSIAEAVRRSMSIPVVYNSRIDEATGHEMMDGGICDNFPFWIFSDAGSLYFNAGRIAGKKVFGFLLNEDKDINTSHPVIPAKFRDRNNKARSVDIMEGLLQNTGIPVQIDSSQSNRPDNKLMEREFRKINLINKRSEISLELLKSTLMPALYAQDFLFAEIPVKGYSWLDFTVNASNTDYRGMLQRGWHAVMDVIKDPSSGLRVLNDRLPY